jgi:hypothetical protein
MKPSVGVPSDEHRAVCVYSPLPGEPQCGIPATVHIRTVVIEYGDVGLASCDGHASVARSAGRFVAEHEHEGYCGFPSTLWHDELNRCVLDDSGIEPSRALAEASQ